MSPPRRPASHAGHLASFLHELHTVEAGTRELIHDGWRIAVPSGVFRAGLRETMDTCGALLDQEPPPPGAAALDMGCGAGNVALVLAGRGLDVLAVDISPAAILATEENAARNGVRVRTRLSDLFSRIDASEVFHLIFFNIPFLERPEESAHSLPIDRAWYQSAADLERYFKGATAHLAPGGVVVALTSTWADHDPAEADRAAARAGLVVAGHVRRQNHWTLPGLAGWPEARVQETFVACRYRTR